MHAFLVLAHDDPRLCNRLVSRLAEVGEVYVHVDARTDIAPFDGLRRHARVLDGRIPVFWGGWSILRASCTLAARALENPQVDTLTLVSGRHYPLVSPERIVAAPARERIRLIPAPDATAGKPPEKFDRRYVSRFAPSSPAAVVANAVARRLPRLDLDAALDGRQLYAGSTWWSLSRRTYTDAMRIIDTDPRLVRHFRRLIAPDETLLHTAVGEVLRRRHGSPGHTVADRETTFVVWDGGRHPAPLDRDALDAARDQGWWFARKFSSDRPELIEYAEQGWT